MPDLTYDERDDAQGMDEKEDVRMDPQAALIRMLALVGQTRESYDGGEPALSEDEWSDRANELAEIFASLDAWLSRGGFLPKRWGVDAGRFDHSDELIALIEACNEADPGPALRKAVQRAQARVKQIKGGA